MKKFLFLLGIISIYAASVGLAENLSHFFRVVSDQQTRITSFDLDGVITWTNSVSNSTCEMQWSRSINGPWFETYFSNPFECSGLAGSATVSSSFRNNTANTIFKRTRTYVGSTVIDINQDGTPELTFSAESLGFEITVTTHGNTKIDSTARGSNYFIDTTKASKSGLTLLHSGWAAQGSWQNTSYGFMPVIFEKNGNQYCGYVEIWLYNSGTLFMPELRILSYAYDMEPSRPIYAGAGQ